MKIPVEFAPFLYSAFSSRLPNVILIALVGVALSANGDVIVSDNFESYSVGSELNAMSGGSGWNSEWTVAGNAGQRAATTIQNSGSSRVVQVGNGTTFGTNSNNMIVRSFEPYSGDEFFVSLDIVAAAGYENSDLFMFWTDNNTTGTHTNGGIPTAGFSSDAEVVGRIGGSTANIVKGGPVMQGTEYRLVIRVWKSNPGSGNNYDSLQFWIDPTDGDLSGPVNGKTAAVAGSISEISAIGFRSNSNEPDNTYQFDNVVVGTKWSDVVSRAKSAAARDPNVPAVQARSLPAQTGKTQTRESLGESCVYKTVADRELKIYAVLPEKWTRQDKRPAIVLFHGGGWVKGEPSALKPQAAFLSSKGMVCFLAEYRLISGSMSPEPCISDAKSAMRWVRSHATEWGIDPDRIAAGGGSAGAQLAAATALLPGFDASEDDLSVSPKPQALVLLNPVIDNGPEGYGYSRVGERYREFSPAHNVASGAPPTLIMSGTADKTVPIRLLQRFEAAMQAANVRCDLRLYEGGDHGFYMKSHSGGKFHDLTLSEMESFFHSLGWLS